MKIPLIRDVKICRLVEITFSRLHANIRSIPRNLDNFEKYIASLDIHFSLIALSETWLKPENEHCYGLEGYTAEHNVRKVKVGGGVSLLITDGIDYTRREDLCTSSNVAETLFVEIDKSLFGGNSNIVVGVLYRPPDSDMSLFNEFANDLASKIKTEKKNVLHSW